MNFCLKIDNTMINNNISVSNDINSINTNISLKKININHNIIFKEYNKIVSSEKTKIDELENCENWDKMKKIGNPYELVYTTYNKKRKNDSISQYIPISRSYFKMW